MTNKVIIGIVGEERIYDARKLIIFNDNVSDLVIKNKAIPLGLLPTNINASKELSQEEKDNLHAMLDLCSGVILQGGQHIYAYQIEAINYIREKNIPVLGICLGMQIMALAAGGTKKRFHDEFHRQKGLYIHPVIIDSKSKLYGIIKETEIAVNSSHICYIDSVKDYIVTARHNETIEAIELPDKLFHIGVQWHPETMFDEDNNMKKLVSAFFEACEQYKSTK